MRGGLVCGSGVPAAEDAAETTKGSTTSEVEFLSSMIYKQQVLAEFQRRLAQSQQQLAQPQQQLAQSQQPVAEWWQQVKQEHPLCLEEDERLQQVNPTLATPCRERQKQRWGMGWAVGGLQPPERWCLPLSGRRMAEQRHQQGVTQLQKKSQVEQEPEEVEERLLIKPRASAMEAQRREEDQLPRRAKFSHCLHSPLLLSRLFVRLFWAPVLPFSLLALVFSFKRHRCPAIGRSLVFLFLSLLILPSWSPSSSAEATARSSNIRACCTFKTRIALLAAGVGPAALLLRCPTDAATTGERFVRRRERPTAAAALRSPATSSTHTEEATGVPTPSSVEIKAHGKGRRVELRQAAAVPGVVSPGRGVEKIQESTEDIVKARAPVKAAAQRTTPTAARSSLADIGGTSGTAENKKTISLPFLVRGKSKASSLGGKTLRISLLALPIPPSFTSLLTTVPILNGPLRLLSLSSGTSSSVIFFISPLTHTHQIPPLDPASSRALILFATFQSPVCDRVFSRTHGTHRSAPLPAAPQIWSYAPGWFPSLCPRVQRVPTPSMRSISFFFSWRAIPSAIFGVTPAEGVPHTANGTAAAMAYLPGSVESVFLSSLFRKLGTLHMQPRRYWQVALTSFQANKLVVRAGRANNGTKGRGTLRDSLTSPQEPPWDTQRQTRRCNASVNKAERILHENEGQGKATPFGGRDAADHCSAGQVNEVLALRSESKASEKEHAISVAFNKAAEVQCDDGAKVTSCGSAVGLLTKKGMTTAATAAGLPSQGSATGMSVPHSHLRSTPSGSREAAETVVCANVKNASSFFNDETAPDCVSDVLRCSSEGGARSGRKRSLTNRHNIGERRRVDRRLNWFKQYPYAPEHPAASRKGKGIKVAAGESQLTVPTEMQVLPSRPLPHSLRWKVLAETPAPAAAAAAAAAAATQAALDVLESSTISAKRRKSKKRLKKQALARAAVAAAAAAQKAPGSAALVAAARWLQAAHLQKSLAVETATSTNPATVVAPTAAVARPRRLAKALSKTGAAEAPHQLSSPGTAVTISGGQRNEKVLDAAGNEHHTVAVVDTSISSGSLGPAASTGVDLYGKAGVFEHLSATAENTQNSVDTLEANNVSGSEKQQSPSLLSLLYPSKDAAYPPQLAFFVMKQLVTSKFNESVELHVQLNLGSGPRGKARTSGATAGRVRGYVTLPHGTFGELAEFARSGRQRQQEQMEELQISRNTRRERAFHPLQSGAFVLQEDTRQLKQNHVLSGTAKASRTEGLKQASGPVKESASEEQQLIKGSTEVELQEGHRAGGVHTAESHGALRVSTGTVLPPAAEAVLHDETFKEETGIVRGRKKGGVWRRRRIIAAFVDKGDEKAAIQAGADVVGVEKILSLIRDDAINFDVLISTPDMVARLTRYGKTLGPKNLLPQDAWGTLSSDFCGAIRLYRQTTITYKSDKFNIVHMTIGHASMPPDHLVENLEAALRALHCSRPPSAGSNFFHKVHVSSTMGPGILIDMKHVRLTAGGRSFTRG